MTRERDTIVFKLTGSTPYLIRPMVPHTSADRHTEGQDFYEQNTLLPVTNSISKNRSSELKPNSSKCFLKLNRTHHSFQPGPWLNKHAPWGTSVHRHDSVVNKPTFKPR